MPRREFAPCVRASEHEDAHVTHWQASLLSCLSSARFDLGCVSQAPDACGGQSIKRASNQRRDSKIPTTGYISGKFIFGHAYNAISPLGWQRRVGVSPAHGGRYDPVEARLENGSGLARAFSEDDARLVGAAMCPAY
jgi:hypothetical protein